MAGVPGNRAVCKGGQLWLKTGASRPVLYALVAQSIDLLVNELPAGAASKGWLGMRCAIWRRAHFRPIDWARHLSRSENA